MAAENCLWGAPRIHGELLKLGIAISERTVSRYLRGRPPTRSQTWRTFFANHFGDRTLISPLMFADASGDDIVVDASDVSFRSAPSIDASCASIHGPNIDWVVHSDMPLGVRLSHNHLQNRPGARKSSGRAPAVASTVCSQPRGARVGSLWCAHRATLAQCEIIRPRELATTMPS